MIIVENVEFEQEFGLKKAVPLIGIKNVRRDEYTVVFILVVFLVLILIKYSTIWHEYDDNNNCNQLNQLCLFRVYIVSQTLNKYGKIIRQPRCTTIFGGMMITGHQQSNAESIGARNKYPKLINGKKKITTHDPGAHDPLFGCCSTKFYFLLSKTTKQQNKERKWCR